MIQLLTPNNLGGTWRRICSLNTRSVSALEVLHNRALQIDIYFTYLLLAAGDKYSVIFKIWTHSIQVT